MPLKIDVLLFILILVNSLIDCVINVVSIQSAIAQGIIQRAVNPSKLHCQVHSSIDRITCQELQKL